LIFKGKSYSGKLAFAPLPVGTKEVTLHLDRFVLEFGIYDIPKTQLDLSFGFQVRSEVIEGQVAQQ
jgi:NAD dependent epimerase/dehydratase family enzyme